MQLLYSSCHKSAEQELEHSLVPRPPPFFVLRFAFSERKPKWTQTEEQKKRGGLGTRLCSNSCSADLWQLLYSSCMNKKISLQARTCLRVRVAAWYQLILTVGQAYRHHWMQTEEQKTGEAWERGYKTTIPSTSCIFVILWCSYDAIEILQSDWYCQRNQTQAPGLIGLPVLWPLISSWIYDWSLQVYIPYRGLWRIATIPHNPLYAIAWWS